MDNPYIRLTNEFNEGRLRAILASGQAVVLYRLAIMSKDGDWILREEVEALEHVLQVLERHDARYRYGAPLDLRWMRHGWSSHFELRETPMRLRCDFVTRPPRTSPEALSEQWEAPVAKEVPVVSLPFLADLKKTNREKDYAVLGELARKISDPATELLHSRSARDILKLAANHPEAAAGATSRRPLLALVTEGREALERALDEERRMLIRANEQRLARYLEAAEPWAGVWRGLSRELAALPLRSAHEIMVERATSLLPREP